MSLASVPFIVTINGLFTSFPVYEAVAVQPLVVILSPDSPEMVRDVTTGRVLTL